jgi:hypothetical protein
MPERRQSTATNFWSSTWRLIVDFHFLSTRLVGFGQFQENEAKTTLQQVESLAAVLKSKREDYDRHCVGSLPPHLAPIIRDSDTVIVAYKIGFAMMYGQRITFTSNQIAWLQASFQSRWSSLMPMFFYKRGMTKSWT